MAFGGHWSRLGWVLQAEWLHLCRGVSGLLPASFVTSHWLSMSKTLRSKALQKKLAEGNISEKEKKILAKKGKKTVAASLATHAMPTSNAKAACVGLAWARTVVPAFRMTNVCRG